LTSNAVIPNFIADEIGTSDMLDVIKQLLILQERDRRILQVNSELSDLDPQRRALEVKAAQTQTALESVRAQLKQWENGRNQSELEVVTLKERIERYSLQQYQTKKNDEYRALGHEIEQCQEAIIKQEDQQLDFMEKIEAMQQSLKQVTQSAHESKSLVDSKLAELSLREQNLHQQLLELQSGREQIAATIDEGTLNRYERLLKHKGDRVLVGIDRGVCAGCHMILPTHLLIACQSDQEIIICSNCGRMLFYTADMDATHADG
jgi:uncharacterized protein